MCVCVCVCVCMCVVHTCIPWVQISYLGGVAGSGVWHAHTYARDAHTTIAC